MAGGPVITVILISDIGNTIERYSGTIYTQVYYVKLSLFYLACITSNLRNEKCYGNKNHDTNQNPRHSAPTTRSRIARAHSAKYHRKQ